MFDSILNKMGDRVVGLASYLVLFIDLLGLRTAGWQGILAAVAKLRTTAIRARVAIALMLAPSLLGVLSRAMVGLVAFTVFTVYIAQATAPVGQAVWTTPFWAFFGTVVVAFLVMAREYAAIAIARANAQPLGYVDALTGADVNVAAGAVPPDNAVPVPNPAPLRISFFDVLSRMQVAAWLVTASLFVYAVSQHSMPLGMLTIVSFLVPLGLLAGMLFVGAWLVEKVTKVTEFAGNVAQQILALLPEFELDTLRQQIKEFDLLDEEAAAAKLRAAPGLVAALFLPYLLIVLATGMYTWIAWTFGVFFFILACTAGLASGSWQLRDFLEERRNAFLKFMVVWLPWIGAVMAGLITGFSAMFPNSAIVKSLRGIWNSLDVWGGDFLSGRKGISLATTFGGGLLALIILTLIAWGLWKAAEDVEGKAKKALLYGSSLLFFAGALSSLFSGCGAIDSEIRLPKTVEAPAAAAATPVAQPVASVATVPPVPVAPTVPKTVVAKAPSRPLPSVPVAPMNEREERLQAALRRRGLR